MFRINNHELLLIFLYLHFIKARVFSNRGRFMNILIAYTCVLCLRLSHRFSGLSNLKHELDPKLPIRTIQKKQ